MKLRLLLVSAGFAALFAGSRVSRAADAGSQDLAAQQVVHLLEYVGSDYGGAVKEGHVVNETELTEQLEVIAEAERIAAKLAPRREGAAPRQRPPREAVLEVQRLVQAHRAEGEVSRAVKAVSAELVAEFDLVQAPEAAPTHERGKLLFETHCAVCHGQDGRANTPRAVQYTPRPANFHDPAVARALSPLRVFTTVRFGVPKTAMVPFDFLSDADRWDLAFYVSEFDHELPTEVASSRPTRFTTLAELASESDDELRDDLKRAGTPDNALETALADLRRRAPYDADALHPKGAARWVLHARAALKKLGPQLEQGDRDGARQALLKIYLDDIEPIEAPLRARDPALTRDIEAGFKELRSEIERAAPSSELEPKLEGLLGLLSKAAVSLEGTDGAPSFVTTMFSSTGIALREGVEAALLIAALLAVVARAGGDERKKWVHYGWITATFAGVLTWFASQRLVAMSGLGRETLEGVSALLAASVLFYVSYWLFAKREAVRWVSYLRNKAKLGNAAFTLFGISFLAVYREAFETVIFYQALVSQPGSGQAAAAGVLLAAVLLVGLVVAYGRAGKFAPPQSFFAFSSALLYALSIVFAGQGLAALQTTGHIPLHPIALPNFPLLGIYPTVETYAAQVVLVALALGAAFLTKGSPPNPSTPLTAKANGPSDRRE